MVVGVFFPSPGKLRTGRTLGSAISQMTLLSELQTSEGDLVSKKPSSSIKSGKSEFGSQHLNLAANTHL